MVIDRLIYTATHTHTHTLSDANSHASIGHKFTCHDSRFLLTMFVEAEPFD